MSWPAFKAMLAICRCAMSTAPLQSLCQQLNRAPVGCRRDRLPAETLTAEQQRDAFASKGLLPREMVAILGAHTVRRAQGFVWRARDIVRDSHGGPVCHAAPCSLACGLMHAPVLIMFLSMRCASAIKLPASPSLNRSLRYR